MMPQADTDSLQWPQNKKLHPTKNHRRPFFLI